jgi:hypothetical protein
MAYDAAARAVMLFSGMRAREGLADTWTWDGSNWNEQFPVPHPGARADEAMAYDPATRTVVLFGGELFRGGFDHDTWTWG